MKKLLPILLIALFASCTENEKAKSYGGTAEITLPAGEKLINATWKDNDLWYLTRPMLPADSAVSYTFKEKSSFGYMEGTYIIHEVKTPAK
jgi:hypothetical protein